ncbi:MAG: TrbI/VirB10 family protein [Opitutus sp.]|nr:TrbI/VirB10 family protein [Opitutus sp.]
MKFNPEFFTTPPGHFVLIGLVIALGGGVVAWHQMRGRPESLPRPAPIAPVTLPQTFTRVGARFKLPTPAPDKGMPTPGAVTASTPALIARTPRVPEPPPALPLSLYASRPNTERTDEDVPPPLAPFGRLIPCETVVTLESNRLDTPVIGLVSEDVWHDGRLVVPKGAEVHGRASLDRARERLAVAGQWMIVWRTADERNGTELAVQGLALDRERDSATGAWGLHDGSAGLRGELLRTDHDAEIKLFASTFLSTATAALENTSPTAGILGSVSVPAATARNATLAGTSAILREYADRIKDAIARDGFYVRVPAGKAFYLYVTQILAPAGRDEARVQPNFPHEN